MSNIIDIVGLEKVYQIDGRKIMPLSNLSLSIYKGEFVAIMGPSGSGKSTLLNIIGTLDSPTSGEVTLFEHISPVKMTQHERANLRLNRIGFIFQSFNLISFLNAMENVEIPLRLKGIKKKERENKATDILSRVGLDNRKFHKPKQLSFGEQQRVAIARSLVNNPDLVLADEPTGNLDSINSKEIINLMKELCMEKRTSFLLVTHDSSITEVADRVLNIKDGKLMTLN